MVLSIQVRRNLSAGATAFDGALDQAMAFPLWKAIALRKLKVYTAMAWNASYLTVKNVQNSFMDIYGMYNPIEITSYNTL